uniref:RIN4 pathogenic type III effector avirulence factor Avr cleavage site domain-containing protein n=1 Tax=Cannabis sativa TaxID=3483 RepID=A0A803QZK8_CANSA
MEDRKENAPWLSVPQFGDWDQKGGQMPDYSLDFSKIREMRKQNKRDVSRASIGNEEELIAPTTTTSTNTSHSDHHHPHYHENPHSPSVRFLVFPCFVSCFAFGISFYIYNNIYTVVVAFCY